MAVQRADDLREVVFAHMEINRGRLGRRVAQEQLDMVEIRTRLKEVSRKAVPSIPHAE